MSQPATMSPPKVLSHWHDLEVLRKPYPKSAAHASPRTKGPSGYTTLAGAVCHGRVSDLESMVPSQWWQTVFADAMYLKTDGDVVEDPIITKEEVGLLESDPDILDIFLRGSDKNSTVQPARILDLCCGQGRHSLFLSRKYPHLALHGHDQSSYLIKLAQERAAAQQLSGKTVFTVGDCRQIPYADETFDLVVVMGNSFGYFADEQGDRTVLSEIFRTLVPGGRLVLDLTDGDYMRTNFAERSWEWIDDKTFVCRERQLSKDGLRLSSREVVTLTTKGVIRDQFYQERLYGREEVYEIVENAGFGVAHEPQESGSHTLGKDLSKRKEDLGMMEQRVMVKATKPAHRAVGRAIPIPNGVKRVNGSPLHVNGHHANGVMKPAKTNGINGHAVNGNHQKLNNGWEHQTVECSRPSMKLAVQSNGMECAPFPHITVLLGDPAKPCIGKLNDTWNPEDLETRRKLFTALHELGYPPDRISVLDRHEKYLSQLSNSPSTFVLNLCDEGFDNDALKELHVPALLDMLRIPYSGAGPNCLAACYDKGLVNRTAASIGVPTPNETFYFSDTATPAVQDLENLARVIVDTIGYPAFIKPIKGDNSLGITSRSIVNNEHELAAYMDELRSIGIRDVIIQEYLSGPEYGVGMIGNRDGGFHFFPVLEVDYSRITAKKLPPILGFESKWDPTSPYWTDISYKEATALSPATVTRLRERCVALSERFGCRDYARFDFRADRDGEIKLLEVNPNPGWCWDGKLAYMGKLEGLKYCEVIGMILRAAWERVNRASSSSSSSAAHAVAAPDQKVNGYAKDHHGAADVTAALPAE
ncbi:hypothetical protein BDZ88DRAFT_17394 [Geranomyces variabilis]|nr:hypothetical protein BDZ88DRAFT_17394 [Geranomyces variabilis]